MLIRLSAAIALALTIFTSCGMDPDNLYGKRKEFQILDEHGKSTTHAYASKISGTFLKIVGGLGGHHRVEVEDESVVRVDYYGRGASGNVLWMDTTIPARVDIYPLKFGSTTISITDIDIDKTIHVQVDVVNEYEALTIKESTVEGMDKGMKIAFAIDATNEYHIASKEGSEYYSESKGEYHFHEYSDSDYLLLTLKDAEGETTWKITDADNNKDNRKNYISDILEGLNLSNRVTTKFSPALNYPSLFLFTDTANPDRHFVTGSCNENIKWIFE